MPHTAAARSKDYRHRRSREDVSTTRSRSPDPMDGFSPSILHMRAANLFDRVYLSAQRERVTRVNVRALDPNHCVPEEFYATPRIGRGVGTRWDSLLSHPDSCPTRVHLTDEAAWHGNPRRLHILAEMEGADTLFGLSSRRCGT